MIYEWHCIFTPRADGGGGVGETAKEGSGRSHRVKSEQLKESRDEK